MPAIIDRWLTSFGEKTDYLTIGRYRPGLNLRQFTVKTLHPELVHGYLCQFGSEFPSLRGIDLPVRTTDRHLIVQWIVEGEDFYSKALSNLHQVLLGSCVAREIIYPSKVGQDYAKTAIIGKFRRACRICIASGDMSVTGSPLRDHKPSGNASGQSLVGNRPNRLPEGRDARRTFNRRGVRRARRSTSSGCRRLAKRTGQGEFVEAGRGLSRPREHEKDGSSESELIFPKRRWATLSSDLACWGTRRSLRCPLRVDRKQLMGVDPMRVNIAGASSKPPLSAIASQFLRRSRIRTTHRVHR